MSAPSRRDGRGGTDVGGRRHGRDVGREGDERAGARGATAGRAHPDDDRDLGASSCAWTMSRVASSEPPGVSSSMTTAAAPPAAAAVMPSRR